MASKVQICNLALGRLGAGSISSLGENTREARLCDLFFDDLRDELLRAHPWSFAASRIQLAEPAGDVPFGWGFRYQLPHDCLRALFLEAGDRSKIMEFRIEGRHLLADIERATLVYTRRETDTTRYDPLFARALAARLAAELAIPITDSSAKAEALWALCERELARAASADANEGREEDGGADGWIEARV